MSGDQYKDLMDSLTELNHSVSKMCALQAETAKDIKTLVRLSDPRHHHVNNEPPVEAEKPNRPRAK